MSIDEKIFGSRKFQTIYGEVKKIEFDYSLPLLATESAVPDWNSLLFMLSGCENFSDPVTNEIILRCCTAILISDSANLGQKESALLLLERIGNWNIIRLALNKHEDLNKYASGLPIKFWVDLASNRNSFAIELSNNEKILGNFFQKEFWESSDYNNSISLSAPTTSGKSFITTLKIIDYFKNKNIQQALYIVPSKALIEEISQELYNQPDLSDVLVINYPWDFSGISSNKKIYVMTQERAFIALTTESEFCPDIVFIDESQKINDGGRGVLLENIIRLISHRFPSANLIFASPLTKNPELLNEEFKGYLSGKSIVSNLINVTQNLFTLEKVKGNPRKISVGRLENGNLIEERQFVSKKRFSNNKFQLISEMVTTFSRAEDLNIIYATEPSAAEKIAKYIYNLLPEGDLIPSDIKKSYIELIQEQVHPQYLLSELIDKGVAFHYGRIPQIVKSEIEELFKQGYIKYLVSTSTLSEGVNLPCKNLWIADLRKGRRTEMTPTDFWNLAGRAGRWGKEFSGNIFFIKNSQFDSPPKKDLQMINLASKDQLSKIQNFDAFLTKGSGYDALASMLFTNRLEDKKFILENKELENQIDNYINETSLFEELPTDIIYKNSSINPVNLLNLKKYLVSSQRDISLLNHQNRLAADNLLEILKVCNSELGADFGDDSYLRHIARLLINWADGHSIPQIITNQINYEREVKSNKSIDSIIRATLRKIQDIVLFKAPKYLSAYQDIYSLTKQQIDNKDLDRIKISYEIFELGVSEENPRNLVKIGFSRQTAMNISQRLPHKNMDIVELLRYIEENHFEDLSTSAYKEINKILERKISSRINFN